MSFIVQTILCLSPFTSYGDLLYSIQKNRSSEGFSIDICGLLLASSILRIFFWVSERFETALLLQSVNLILVHSVILFYCLKYRPLNSHGQFVKHSRPYNLWQWDNSKTYWEFLFYFTIAAAALHVMFGSFQIYISILGFAALGLESIIPIPQIIENNARKSVTGFKLSVIGSWLLGDIGKLIYFLLSPGISIQFKIGACFQAICDCIIAYQYYIYKDNVTIVSNA